MPWTMEVNPLHNLFLSALLGLLPILAMFWALAIRKMRGYAAALFALAVALIVAVLGYRMPLSLSLLSVVHGMLFGLFPIAWIVANAVFLYNLTVKAGQFEAIRNSIASITGDRRLQALLIAFSFGSFLEGAAGFGAPVAITASMLAGLGFNPLYAAGICLLANTAPVAYGAIGIPIIVAGQVSGIEVMAVSTMVGRTLLPIAAIIPLYLVVLMAGWKKMIAVWPAIAVSGISYGIVQWLTAEYLGPYLPGIVASLVSIILLILLLRVWHPAQTWHFPEEPPGKGKEQLQYTGGQILTAWAPFILLTVFIAAWGMSPIKSFLDSLALSKFEIPGLHHMVVKDGTPMSAIFTLNYLSSAGTSLLFAAIVSSLLLGMSAAQTIRVYRDTLKDLRFPIVTIATVLGFAYILNFSGMAITLGNALAATGALFPFLSPFIGWIGVFITGSDTSSNALFSKLQQVTAVQTEIDPLIPVAANSTGGVIGKMISPQSLAVAAAAVGLAGREADILRFTLRHSLLLVFAVAALTVLQAYALPWFVPDYARTTGALTGPEQPSLREGAFYLGLTLALVVTIFILVRVTNRKSRF